MTNTTAIVLAGGLSSRMGRAKALLPFGGRPLVAHVVATLRVLTDDIVVAAAPDQELPSLAATVVRDEVPHQGPMRGIYNGLCAARSPVCFVTSCDSAFIDPALVSYLLARVAAYDVVVPRWQRRLQPLHAVYRRSIAPLFEQALLRGERRPAALFNEVRTRTIEEDEIRQTDPEGWSFFNINTPAEYRRAIEHLASSHAEGEASCTVELFGVARLLARTGLVPLSVPADASVSDVFSALADRYPRLVGHVISADRRTLRDGYVCNVNGAEFIRSPRTPVASGDSLLILSADAGG